MIAIQSIHFLQLQGLNIQTNSSGNIIGIVNKQRFIEELTLLTEDESGCIRFECEKRYKPAKNGKPYTHMAPVVEQKPIITPQVQE